MKEIIRTNKLNKKSTERLEKIKAILEYISSYEKVNFNLRLRDLSKITTYETNNQIAGYFDVNTSTIFLEKKMVENPKIFCIIYHKRLFDMLLHEIAHYKFVGHGKDFHNHLRHLKQDYGFLREIAK